MLDPENAESHSSIPDAPLADPTNRRERSQLQTRRTYLRRMLIFPVILAIVLIFVLMLGRERLVRREYLAAMQQLGISIEAFRNAHNRLPAPEQLITFDLKSRSLQADKVHYPDTYIPNDIPGDMVLAYAPKPHMRFLQAKHCVLYANGSIEWLDTQQLTPLLERRLQFLNKATLR